MFGTEDGCWLVMVVWYTEATKFLKVHNTRSWRLYSCVCVHAYVCGVCACMRMYVCACWCFW